MRSASWTFLLSALGQAWAAPSTALKTRGNLVPALSGSSVDMTSGVGGTYPRANFLSDGSIIGSYTAFTDGNNVLTLAQSTDQGASWTNIGTASSRPSDSSDLDNPYPLQLPSGRVLLAFRNHDVVAGSNPKQYTYYRITVTYSDDNGATWAYLSTVAEHAATSTNNGLWEPFLRVAQDGSLQVYYSEENGATDQDSMMQVSQDGGATWSAATTISGAGIEARDGMVGVATVSGSNLIAVFESVPPGGTFTVNAISSSDDGATWGDRRLVYAPTGSDNNAGAPQVVNVGGSLVVSFMTDEDTQEHSWVNGAGAKMVTSPDGVNFGDKIEVFQPQANWPGLLSLDSTSLLFMADYGGAKSQLVTLS